MYLKESVEMYTEGLEKEKKKDKCCKYIPKIKFKM